MIAKTCLAKTAVPAKFSASIRAARPVRATVVRAHCVRSCTLSVRHWVHRGYLLEGIGHRVGELAGRRPDCSAYYESPRLARAVADGGDDGESPAAHSLVHTAHGTRHTAHATRLSHVIHHTSLDRDHRRTPSRWSETAPRTSRPRSFWTRSLSPRACLTTAESTCACSSTRWTLRLCARRRLPPSRTATMSSSR